NYESKWTSEFKQKAKDLGYSQDEVMIIASIIQREAKDVSQMKVISSVIRNRLADPATYPLLEMNSTRDYISSTNEYGVFTDFYYSLYLSSYNTYSEEGLPPGAICNPGIEAIEAALNPDDTNYHFFCHDSKGNIYLASTAAEHKANTEKILYETD
ncbi:MAG: endolytic transglycosylase MltG, partial [Monoglobaceae bacterium]